MKNKKIVQKAGSRFLAMMLSVAMVVPGTAFVPAEYSGAIEALAATIDIAEDFESGEPKGYVRGSGSLTVVEEGHAGKALSFPDVRRTGIHMLMMYLPMPVQPQISVFL